MKNILVGLIYRPCMRYAFLLGTFIVPVSCHAAMHSSYLSTLIQTTQKEALYTHPSWLALLHYNREPKVLSYAISDTFFIAKDGRHHPEHEMMATLTSLFTKSPDETATQCKFPARFQWLKQQLSIDESRLPSHQPCLQYKAWRQEIHPKSITLVFPGPYMNAPSSVFGHTLLRIDSSEKDPDNLLAHSISFAAEIPDGTGNMKYIIGGLNGAFHGRYQHALYHQKIKEYGRIENRDIWEYTLNLKQQEIERLLMHLWEIKNIHFRYLFARENCSYRLLELLEVARNNSHLTEHFPLYAIPSDTIRLLAEQGFILSVKYRPSAATRLHAEISELSPHEQKLALQLSQNDQTLTSDDFLNLPETRKAHVIQLAYRYLKWKQIQSWKQADQQLPYRLIKQLESYPAVEQPRVHSPIRPDAGHATKRLRISAGHEQSNYIQLGFRPLYHGLLDNIPGYDPGTEITFLNTELRFQQQSVHLHQLDILKLVSLRPINLFLRPVSWETSIELTRNSFRRGYHLIPRISTAFGYTFQLMQETTLSFLPAVRLNITPVHNQDGIIQMGGIIEYIAQRSWGTTHIQGNYYYAVDKHVNTHGIQVSQTFAIGRNQSIQFHIGCKDQCRKDNLDFNLGFSAYF